MIPVARPDVGEAELQQVREALSSGWIGLGPKVGKFEERFGDRFGHENVVATNSCTSALDLAVKVAARSGTEVLVPPITWVSTAHVANYNGYEVSWVDVDPDTLCMSSDALAERISTETAAVIPVHYGGQPVEIDEIVRIAHEHDAAVIEDCAHAPGATYEDEPIGSFGDAGCFSFQATKPLTTGEGGALVTNDADLAERAKRLSKLGVDKSTHERSGEDGYSWYYEVTDTGYKYFMHDISAGMGLAQIERFDETNERRNEVAARYRAAFEDVGWADPLDVKDHATQAWYNYTVLVPPEDRADVIAHLADHEVGATVHYMPLYRHPVFDERPDTPVTERVWERILTLPMSSTFSDEEVDRVINALLAYEPRTD